MWPFSTMLRDAGPEERGLNWLAFEDIRLAATTDSGVPVSESNATNLAAVYRCVSLNSDTISSLPVDCLVKRGDTRLPYPEPSWLRRPNDFQNLQQFVAELVTSLDLDGNAFVLKSTDTTGRLAGLYPLAPTAVSVERLSAADPRIIYRVTTSGGQDVYAANEIMHVRSLTLPGELRGLSPIKAASQAIGIGFAAERFGANFFGSGATLSGVITAPGQLTQEQAERLKEAFSKKHGGISRSHAVGVLSGGAAWTPLSVKPDEAQFLETRRYTDAQIANLYGIPPEFVSDVEGAKGYVTSLSMRLRMWHLTGLLPRITRLEQALSDLLPRPAYVKFNVNGLLRMDPEQRTAFYQAAQLGEWMTRNEIRALEDMNPIEDGDEMLHSVQWQENVPEEPEEEAPESEDEPEDEPAEEVEQ